MEQEMCIYQVLKLKQIEPKDSFLFKIQVAMQIFLVLAKLSLKFEKNDIRKTLNICYF